LRAVFLSQNLGYKKPSVLMHVSNVYDFGIKHTELDNWALDIDYWIFKKGGLPILLVAIRRSMLDVGCSMFIFSGSAGFGF